jgi:hypothetical protein
MNHKELVQKFFKGRAVPRPPFIPLLGTYLTRVSQVSVEDLLKDSSTLSSAIVNTQQLLEYDALTLPIDQTVEIEAFGASVTWDAQKMPAVKDHLSLMEPLDGNEFSARGRIPILLETVKRLVLVNGNNYPVIASITGPLTILRNLYSEEVFNHDFKEIENKIETITNALIQLCKSFGDEKVDGIIINEDLRLDKNVNEELFRSYKPIFNVIKFYNIFGILRIPSEVKVLNNSTNIPDCLVGSQSLVSSLTSIKTKGVALEEQFWEQELNYHELTSIWKENNKKRLFFSTSLPLDLHLDLKELQEKTAILCEDATWA